MASQKQRQAARRNVKRAQAGARQKKTITKLPKNPHGARTRGGQGGSAQARGHQGHG